MLETKRWLHSLESFDAPRVSSFLEQYDSWLQSDPVEAIREANALVSDLRKQTSISPPLPPAAFFFPLLLGAYFNLLSSSHPSAVCACNHVLELLAELLSQPPTRPYLLVYLKDRALVVRSRFLLPPESTPLLNRLQQYIHADDDDARWQELSVFQRILFK